MKLETLLFSLTTAILSVMTTTLHSMEITDKSPWNYTEQNQTRNRLESVLSKNGDADHQPKPDYTNSTHNSIHRNFSESLMEVDTTINATVSWNVTEVPVDQVTTNPVCIQQVCLQYPVKRTHKQAVDDRFSLYERIAYSDRNYHKKLLDLAPCPPPWNIPLICELKSTRITCNEKTHILSKCLNSYSSLRSYCNELLTCSRYLPCERFGRLLDKFSQCSIKYRPFLTTPPVVTISGGHHVTPSNTSSTILPGQRPIEGPVSIVLIVVILLGFIFIPFLVYLLLNRDYRRALGSCCLFICRNCRCRRRQTRPTPIEETEIEPIATVAPMTPKKAAETNSISRDLSNDSGIGLFMDYDFIDDDVPPEYQVL